MSEEMTEGAAAEVQGTEGGAGQAGQTAQAEQAAQESGQAGAQGGGTLLSGALSQEATAKAADTPQTYDLQLPEGAQWTPEQLTAFQGQAKDLGLTQVQAQKLLEASAAHQQAAKEAHQAQVKQWFNEIKMDKEMGGAAFDATDMYATAAIRKFDHEGRLAELLQTSGYVNHPEVIRALARVGRALGDDALVTGKETAEQAPLEDRLYPNSNK